MAPQRVNEEEKTIRNRANQKRYYEAHKDEIIAKRKEKRHELKEKKLLQEREDILNKYHIDLDNISIAQFKKELAILQKYNECKIISFFKK